MMWDEPSGELSTFEQDCAYLKQHGLTIGKSDDPIAKDICKYYTMCYHCLEPMVMILLHEKLKEWKKKYEHRD